jgi:hypothetical protein
VLRYEDIASDPVPSFKALYEELGLSWSGEVERTVSAHSSGENRDEVPAERPHEIKRDSRAAAGTWRTRLSADEIARIRSETGEIWPRFYSEQDWVVGPSTDA